MFIPIVDRIETDKNTLYSISGNSTATLSTKGLVRTGLSDWVSTFRYPWSKISPKPIVKGII
ncbi:hypothetical protein [Paraglaciecola sp. 20A4]|uniref:hypothetical protein n=1 Tax=Paraglaciecola sp. 20A4 TaxID=2687288 RepID=UPI0014072208|nr:hypothetical protein [Paraglaciecola sp. 20A4]